MAEEIPSLMEVLQKISSAPLAALPQSSLCTFQFSKTSCPIQCYLTISLISHSALSPCFQLMLLPLSNEIKEQLGLSASAPCSEQMPSLLPISSLASPTGISFTAVHLHPLPEPTPLELISNANFPILGLSSVYLLASPKPDQLSSHQSLSSIDLYETGDSDETFEDMPENWFGPEGEEELEYDS